jgi:hypothetical protein
MRRSTFEDRVLPSQHFGRFVCRNGWSTQRIRGVKILNHQQVFDLGRDVKQMHRVIVPRTLGAAIFEEREGPSLEEWLSPWRDAERH